MKKMSSAHVDPKSVFVSFLFIEKNKSRVKHLHKKNFKTTKRRQEEENSIKQRTPLMLIYF